MPQPARHEPADCLVTSSDLPGCDREGVAGKSGVGLVVAVGVRTVSVVALTVVR
jgi:hypothetical protein